MTTADEIADGTGATIPVPEGWTPPDGYHFGAHVSLTGASGYYLIRDSDGLACPAIPRPDLGDEDAPDADAIDAAIDEPDDD